MNIRMNKEGGALIMVLMVLFALTILSAGMLQLSRHGGRESIQQGQNAQAFWLAESGLQQTLRKILTDQNYRSAVSSSSASAGDPDGGSPYRVNIGSGSEGEYGVEVWKSGNDYYIYAQGNVRGMKRRVHILAANVRPDLSYALMVMDGNARIKKDSTVEGGLYSNGGDLTLFRGVSIDGMVYSNDDPGGDYNHMPIDEPIELEFKKELYKDQLDDASSGSLPGGYWAGKWEDDTIDQNHLELDDDVLYVNGDVKIGSLGFSGTREQGVLVVNGNLEFTKDYTIGNNIKILLNGNFIAKKEGTLGENLDVFAMGNGEFDKATKASSDGASSMVFVGNFNADKEIDFSGMIYAHGDVNFKLSSIIEGTVVAGSGNFDIDKDSRLIYNQDKIPLWVLEEMIVPSTYTSDNTWNELIPL